MNLKALSSLIEYQLAIEYTFGEYIPTKDFSWIDGGWTIDGMDPIEWAQTIFGEDD